MGLSYGFSGFGDTLGGRSIYRCFGLWSVVCGLWSVVCGCGLWSVVCGPWSVVCGLWSVVCGLRILDQVNGEEAVASASVAAATKVA